VRGGLPALHLLNTLLFGETAPPRHPLFASIPPPAGYGLELKVTYPYSWQGGVRSGRVWAQVGIFNSLINPSTQPHTRNHIHIPGLQGNRDRYYDASNSLI